MDYKANYKLWCNSDFFDKATQAELRSVTDEKEIEDRFYCDLKFGTGGMRGIMGAGTNRFNKYTVGRATTGFVRFLRSEFGDKACLDQGVAIAYDTRNNSREYAESVADIITGAGIRVRIFNKPVPTPELSFTVRRLGCIAGIVITASHNPKEYNGYKIYDENGGQLVVGQAKRVIRFIKEIDDYTSVSFQGKPALKEYIDTTDEFVDAVISACRSNSEIDRDRFKLVYTPIHGTGNIPVRAALNRAGYKNVFVVKAQELPDGDFSTVSTPNPENRASMELALQLGRQQEADIVLGTDPDCDRVGIAVLSENGDYTLLTGNQIGALLTDYVVSHKDLSALKKPALIKTVVTSELGAEIARANGIKVFETLTGFKYVGEKMTQFERAKADGDDKRAYDFVIGYEESFGYLAGDYARDKDGVGPCLLLCEMAAEYKKQGCTLLDRLDQLYSQYGYYYDAQDSFKFEGKAGMEAMAAIMAQLRSDKGLFDDIDRIIDYSTPIKAEDGFGMLPTSDVLKFILTDGSWLAIRPSGTEPKIKIYYSIKGKTKSDTERRYNKVRETILDRINNK